MRIVIKTIDGHVHRTEDVSGKELADALAESNLTEDEAVEQMEEMFKDYKDMKYISVEIDGQQVYFNPANIVCGYVER